ncbi:type III-A CRISPR-associated RAMP protein Csm5 [Methanospirillum stamsii]|uniref:CRISPR system Cms protein Csm5 n=1 Tax=Methanospirillum stamsii TaxID=1277351 RepID=A0A2V2MYI4_9EURY|nr:type III-A CRISPR-associated RAMP protein Csm5 [Methanospirillum stamsii]PWR70466.1 type III-A CRISPR-associated RAMP protein Csm5 [Methanospirillum stamsii]
MKIALIARTPVHIGTGQTYFPNEYVTSTGKSGVGFVSRIDIRKFSSVLNEDQRDSFIADLDESFKMTEFFKQNNLVPKDLRRYLVENRSGNHNPQEIRECIKTNNIPYIPGSSLKGAIRTALLWWYAKDDSRYTDSIEQDLENDRYGKKKRAIGSGYVDRVFACNYPGNKPDPKYDLLRFLQVSDCMPVENKTSIESIITYSLQNSGNLRPKNFQIFAECVNGSFSGSIGGLDQIKKVATHRDFPQLKDKISLLGMDSLSDTGAVPAHLQKVLSEWSRWCFSKEQDLVRDDDSCTDYLKPVQSWLSESSHIRLGFGVGTLYQTMIGILEEQDPDLAVRLIDTYKLARGHPEHNVYDTIDPPYPKTLEFTANGDPLGWLSCSFEA